MMSSRSPRAEPVQTPHIQPRPTLAVDSYGRYLRRQRRVIARAAGVVVMISLAVAWVAFGREPLTTMLPWAQAADAPTIATSASFSVTAGSVRGAEQAAALVGDLLAKGLPAYVDAKTENRSAYQVLVGPYVSLDEAEGAQRRLWTHGIKGTRFFIDESMRHALRNDGPPSGLEDPGVVLVSAPDRLAVVLELRAEPKRVTTRWADASTLELDIAPVDGAIHGQLWSVPAGADLVRRVEIAEVRDAAQIRYARARIELPEFSRSSLRVEGRRVYVDLTWPQLAVTASGRRRSAGNGGRPSDAVNAVRRRQALTLFDGANAPVARP